MIRAFIFDLDGTLVETEMLKAKAYAAVSKELLGLGRPDQRAIDVYRRIVGSTDETAARTMMEELGLRSKLPGNTEDKWRALSALQAERYRTEFATGEGLRSVAYPQTIDLLNSQSAAGKLVAVATSSFTESAQRVVSELGINSILDALIGRDQVTNGKPNPEIYLKTAEALGVNSDEVVVVEDSVIGVEAAVRADMRCVAIASAFSFEGLRQQTILDQKWCIYDRTKIGSVVARHLLESENPG